MSVPFALMRHAPTDWNADGRLQGQTDTPLSAKGEADAASWRLPEPACGWKRLCSPLQRARRTAELLQPAAPVTVESRLREMSFGVWEGHTAAEAAALHPEAYARWIVMQRNDAVWNAIYENPAVQAELFKYFNKVYTSNDIYIFKRIDAASSTNNVS